MIHFLCGQCSRTKLRKTFFSSVIAWLGILGGAFPCASVWSSVQLAPVQVGSLATPGILRNCAVTGHYCYAAAGAAGLLVIDVSDAAHPRLVGTCDTGGDAKWVEVSGPTAYVSDGVRGFQVVDISDPANPKIQGTVAQSTGTSHMAVSGSLVYVAGGGLAIVDVSDPILPKRIGFFGIPSDGEEVPLYQPNSVVMSAQLAICGDGPFLWFVDVSDPSNPKLKSQFLLQGDVEGLAVEGSYLLVAADWGGLQVVDISDPLHPRLVESRSLAGFAKSISAAKGIIVISSDRDAFHVFEADQAGALTLLGNYPASTRVNAVTRVGHVCYVAGETGGLQTVDLLPANPQLGAPQVDRNESVVVLAVRGTLAAGGRSVGLSGSVSILEISEAGEASVLGSVSSGLGFLGGIALADGFACYLNVNGDIAEGGSFRTIDLTDPRNPRPLGSLDLDFSAGEVVLQGSHAFVADMDTGLIVVDLSDPRSPTRVTSLDLVGGASDIAVSGDVAYLVSEQSGLHVVDLQDPARPVRLGGFSDLKGSVKVRVAGHVCFVGENGRVTLFDVNDPRSPKVTGSYLLKGYLSQMEVSEGVLYLSGFPGGLEILDVSNPALPRRIGGNSVLGSAGIFTDQGRVFLSGYGATGLSVLPPWQRIQVDTFDIAATGQFGLRLYGLPGEQIKMERSANLSSWSLWQTFQLGDVPIRLNDDREPGASQVGFYRAVSVPSTVRQP